MAQEFTCQIVKKKNGIREVHLTHDGASQPTEMLLNTPSEMFAEGDVWLIDFKLLRRKES